MTLRQYALLADGERGALVGPRGEIAFLCAPRWHDGAVFAWARFGTARAAAAQATAAAIRPSPFIRFSS